MLILRCLASAATRTPPNAAHSKQKGAWKSSFVGGLCPRTHKLGTRHRGHGSCRPLPHGSEGSLPPYCLQAPPLSPQPEPTGSELPTPRPACPHSRDSAGPDVQPCVGSSHHPLLPQQEATLWSPAVPWPAFRSTDLPAPPLSLKFLLNLQQPFFFSDCFILYVSKMCQLMIQPLLHVTFGGVPPHPGM